MERRALLVTGIAFVILFGWSILLRRVYPPHEVPAAPPSPTAAVAPPALVVSGPESPTRKEEAAPIAAAPAADQTPVAESEVKSAVVITDLFDATFTNSGARLRSLKLRRYRESGSVNGEPLRQLEVVPREMIELDQLPLAIAIDGDPKLEEELNAALYRVDPPRLEIRGAETGTVRFLYRSAQGVEVEKRLTFSGGSYLISVQVTARRIGAKAGAPSEAARIPAALSWGPGFSNVPPGHKAGWSSYEYYGRAVYHTSGRTSRKAGESLKAAMPLAGEPSWAGLEERYFAMVFLPTTRFSAASYAPYVYKDEKGEPRTAARLLVVPEGEGPLSLFVGPKEYDILKATHRALPDVIQFGTYLGPLVKLMLFGLKRIESVTGNYGLAIIALTLVIRVLLFPLTVKSYQAMKKMQRLQPKVQQIREKYKRLPSDPDERREAKLKMNEETMALYRKEGVNPAGGCFPMLVQMPFLFAIYGVLNVAIELRQAPFVAWIHDLSQRDPYYITPVLMTLAQYLSQKMTPVTTPDPMQQRLMNLMPLFFLYIFVNVPSGLVIYWLTSNLFQIGQQLLLNRLEGRLAPQPQARGSARTR